MSKFVHLHVHTEYSLLDGLSNIKKLIKHVKEQEMNAVAITDHGAMYGAIEFFKAAKASEVKPIIGMEGYMTAGKMEDKNKDNFHLLMLAKNDEGYKNLMKLSSLAQTNGYYYRPRFDHETLKKHSKGIIVTSACPQGELAQALLNDGYGKAKEVAGWFLDVFKDDYYLEVQRHNYESFLPDIKEEAIRDNVRKIADNEKAVMEGVVKLSRDLGIPIVATNDAHYIKKEDASAQDALVCIATGKTVSDVKRLRYIDTPTFYLKSADEMTELFRDYPDAIENTVKIADKCDLDIVLGKWFFPEFALPKGVTPNDELTKLANESLKAKIPDSGKEEKERLNYELEIICSKGYAPYFLIVMDMVHWANSEGIITNTRGSAAGSLVSYVLGITTVNPLLYYLPFERFLNPFRPSPPDIDFDVSDERRDDVIKFIADKYGHDKTAQICTFGRMLSRAAVRDVARVLGYPYSIGDRVAKIIPPPKQGFPITIPRALAEVPELKNLYDNDNDTKKILDLAMELEGSARHLSVHAAGVVVAPTDINNFAPTQMEPKGEKLITQYEMHACEDVGLIKFDILGIRNLSILGNAVQIVKKTKGIEVDLRNLPLDDKKTFEMLSRGETMGTFQLGASSGMTKYIKDLKPERVEDLMAMVALYRPGPISQIPEYIKRKNNPKLVKYLDPRMEKFLGASYGLIVYQDDLLFCALDLAGYSWEEADKFRKAVGKKIPEEMAAQKDKFTKGIIANGQTKEFADELWKLFEPFQSYGFNKAHAASYGAVAYQTSYMKANYPVEYMTALLTAESSDTDKISLAINECRRIGIKVLAPDINESDIDFTIVGEKIRFGLSAIKNVGRAAIEAILEAREHGNFLNFADFLSRVDGRRVNKKVLESLIKVGALSEFGKRAQLMASLDEIRNKVSKPKGDDNQQGLFLNEEIVKTHVNAGNTTLIDIPEYTEDEIQSLERQLLGFSLSARPPSELISPFDHLLSHRVNDILNDELVSGQVKVPLVVSEVRIIATKKSGAQMAFVKGEDGTGTIDLVVFPKLFTETRDFWVQGKPLLVHGKVDHRDETPSILVESIETINSNGTLKEKEVQISIPSGVSTEKLQELKRLLMENVGENTAFLVFPEKTIKLSFKINWNESLALQIENLLDF